MGAGLLGAHGQPDPHQEAPLRHRPDQARALCFGGPAQRGKIDPVRQVGLPRLVEQIDRPVCRHGLNRITGIAVAAIINHQHGTATSCHRSGQSRHHKIRLRAELGDHAVLRRVGKGRVVDRRAAIHKADPVIDEADHASMPAAVPPNQLRRGKGVEEFVGDPEQRAFYASHQLVRIRMPCYRCGFADGAILDAAEHRACLHKMHRSRRQLRHQGRPGMAHVAHQRAAAGAELGHDGIGGLAGEFIHMRQVKAAHLAEHAGNFRRGDEIPGFAERVAGLVVAGFLRAEAGRHIGLERHRAVRLYPPANLVLDGLWRLAGHDRFCRHSR